MFTQTKPAKIKNQIDFWFLKPLSETEIYLEKPFSFSYEGQHSRFQNGVGIPTYIIVNMYI